MADYPDRPGYSFNPGPPPEASRFLRNKGLTPSFSWADVEPEEHAVAFTVAKAMETDLLEAMRTEVQKALDGGQTFAAFKKSWKSNPALSEWWGKREMTDPLTGEVKMVQLGSARRLRTIYDANLRVARAAGQWERIERTKSAFPYLEYRLGPSERHRASHAAKEGLILPVESAFWDSWMPPNGWGCKCWVRQVTAAEARRRGISAEPEIVDDIVENERTGERKLVPRGLDPAWSRNPGRLRRQAMEAVLAEKIEALPVQAARAAVRDIATSWRAERVLFGRAPGAVPVAVLPKVLADRVGSKVTVVHTTSEYGEKFQTRRRGVTTETLAALQDALETGHLYLDRDGAAPRLYVVSEGDRPWLYVLKVMRGNGEVWINSMYRLKPSKLAKIQSDPNIERLGN